MDNMDDSENNAKISDSAYSNSCSNSQSRRSHSSKSTHSGSHSSGSSGYGGKPSTSLSSNDLNQQPRKEKETKKKKQVETLEGNSRTERECRPKEDVTNISSTEGGIPDVVMAPPPKIFQTEKGEANMEVCIPETSSVKDEEMDCNMPLANITTTYPVGPPALSNCDGFSCVVSMHDGVVMYTTSSLTATLGFPKDMWIGRSFIDFLHPKDRNTFASQITNGLAIPKNLNDTQEKAQALKAQESTMVCRIRRYRGLSTGFGVKDTSASYMPFLLKFRFRNISDDKGLVVYLVIQTIPFFSAYKTPNETITQEVSFVMRHRADGNLEYIDLECGPYLGYIPQDITNRNALVLYHPGDLGYLQEVYQSIVKEGRVTRSKPYRMITQNGHFIKVETEWSAFINPWSRKLEFVTGKYYIIEGPANPDVFEYPDPEKIPKFTEEQKNQAQKYRDGIIRIMNEVLTKPAEIAKQQMTKRCQDLALFMEILLEEQPKAEEEFRLQIQDVDHSYYEQDSVMLGGISPHHEYNDSKSSTGTPLSYNQLNYNDNLQRYFSSHQPNVFLDNKVLQPNNKAQLLTGDLFASNRLSQYSGDSAELTSSCESGGLVVFKSTSPIMNMENYQSFPLTESLLIKHNAEMEKELMKLHREHRSFSKGDREKVTNEVRQKKKEHLARCNATFQTLVVASNTTSAYDKPHSLKRPSKQPEPETVANKHHCSSSRQLRRKQTTTCSVTAKPLPVITTTVAPQWSANHLDSNKTFILGVGMPPQMSLMSPVSVMPAQCMMYGQPIYGSPIMYSSISPQSPYFHQTVMTPNIQYNNTLNPLCLGNSNYEEACRNTIPLRSPESMRRNKKRLEKFKKRVKKNEQSNVDGDNMSHNRNTNASNTYYVPEHIKALRRKMNLPWAEQAHVTSELIYKYQITKPLEEILSSDKQKMELMEQPSLVNEQLGQLYLDLQLEGVATRLTLEEGITSSSSSGEEVPGVPKMTRTKREYSKLGMIFEEDAPLPSPEEDTC